MSVTTDRLGGPARIPRPPVPGAVPTPEIDAVFTTMFDEQGDLVCSIALRLTGPRPCRARGN